MQVIGVDPDDPRVGGRYVVRKASRADLVRGEPQRSELLQEVGHLVGDHDDLWLVVLATESAEQLSKLSALGSGRSARPQLDIAQQVTQGDVGGRGGVVGPVT